MDANQILNVAQRLASRGVQATQDQVELTRKRLKYGSLHDADLQLVLDKYDNGGVEIFLLRWVRADLERRAQMLDALRQ